MSEAKEHTENAIPPSMARRPLWEKLIVTVLLTALVGPPIGAAICILGASLSPELGIIFILGSLPPDMIMMAAEGESTMALFLLGYVAGGIQATICGLIFLPMACLSAGCQYGFPSRRRCFWRLPLISFSLEQSSSLWSSVLLFMQYRRSPHGGWCRPVGRERKHECGL